MRIPRNELERSPVPCRWIERMARPHATIRGGFARHDVRSGDPPTLVDDVAARTVPRHLLHGPHVLHEPAERFVVVKGGRRDAMPTAGSGRAGGVRVERLPD